MEDEAATAGKTFARRSPSPLGKGLKMRHQTPPERVKGPRGRRLALEHLVALGEAALRSGTIAKAIDALEKKWG
jgi:hypothetical protein